MRCSVARILYSGPFTIAMVHSPKNFYRLFFSVGEKFIAATNFSQPVRSSFFFPRTENCEDYWSEIISWKHRVDCLQRTSVLLYGSFTRVALIVLLLTECSASISYIFLPVYLLQMIVGDQGGARYKNMSGIVGWTLAGFCLKRFFFRNCFSFVCIQNVARASTSPVQSIHYYY